MVLKVNKKIVVALLLLFLGIAAVSITAFTIATPIKPGSYRSFTLTATGHAFDSLRQKTVAVTVSINGVASGKLDSTINLQIEGGTAMVEGYQTLSASKGTGVITPKGQNANFEITMLSSPYVGRSSLWSLTGKTGLVVGNTIQVMLSANNAKLALQGPPILDDLSLTGTILLD